MTTYRRHPSVRECECGHLEADHKSSGSSFPHPLRFGVCLIAGCDCREFRDVEGERDE